MKTFLQTLVLLSIIVFAISCEPEADLYRHFTIKQGDHYASPRIVETLQSKTLTFRAKFDESAIYKFEDKGFQDSKNKLLGFSDCNSLHHENSARFTWQWYNNQLEIYAYCYVNSVRVEKFIGVVNLHESNLYRITLTDTHYVFQLNHGEAISIERGNTCDKGVYYMLWPYFGGTMPAPHNVNVYIQTIL